MLEDAERGRRQRRVLVTGSRGFIGQHLTRVMRAAGYEVLGLDVKAEASAAADEERETGCDILDRGALVGIVKSFRPDAIVHLAARTDLGETKNIAGYAANTVGTNHIIDAVESAACVRRCVFVSSQLVCRLGYEPTGTTDFCPTTLYGQSKVIMEQTVRARNGGGAEWCIARPTTVWGAGMNHHYQRFFRMVAAGRYFHVGREHVTKPYGYVGNTSHQLLRLVEADADSVNRQVFYVADYEAVSLREWADSFARALGAPPIRSVPFALARAGAAVGDAINYFGIGCPFNSFRLNNVLTGCTVPLGNTRRVCGGLPYSLEQGVSETVRWLREVWSEQQRTV